MVGELFGGGQRAVSAGTVKRERETERDGPDGGERLKVPITQRLDVIA